jgi:hypothetical protein
MKKMLVIVSLLAFAICLASGAQAASFPSSALAFNVVGSNVYVVLSCKLAGTIKMQGGTQKFYTLSGLSLDTGVANSAYPVAGSGYVKGTQFIFSLSGSYLTFFADMEGVLEKTNTGAQGVMGRVSSNAGWGNPFPATPAAIIAVSPKTVPLP